MKKKSGGMGTTKMKTVLHEFKEGGLHSGSKDGPVVKSKPQALAIAFSEARKIASKIKKPKKSLSRAHKRG